MNRAERRRQQKLATKQTNKVVAQVIASPEEQIHLALAYKAQQQFKKSEKALRNLINQHPGLKIAYNHLGSLLFEQEKYLEAAKVFKRAADTFADDADIYNNLGTSLDYAKQNDSALAAFQQALALDPKHPNAAFNLGNLYKNLKKYELAENTYLRAIASNPDDNDVKFNLLKLYTDQGRNSDALPLFKEMEPVFKDQPELFTSMGSTLLFLGNKKEAEEKCTKIPGNMMMPMPVIAKQMQ